MENDKNPDSPYGIICNTHNKQGLTKEDYIAQMMNPDALWKCPICGEVAYWDDDRYEMVMYPDDDKDI